MARLAGDRSCSPSTQRPEKRFRDLRLKSQARCKLHQHPAQLVAETSDLVAEFGNGFVSINQAGVVRDCLG